MTGLRREKCARPFSGNSGLGLSRAQLQLKLLTWQRTGTSCPQRCTDEALCKLIGDAHYDSFERIVGSTASKDCHYLPFPCHARTSPWMGAPLRIVLMLVEAFGLVVWLVTVALVLVVGLAAGGSCCAPAAAAATGPPPPPSHKQPRPRRRRRLGSTCHLASRSRFGCCVRRGRS